MVFIGITMSSVCVVHAWMVQRLWNVYVCVFVCVGVRVYAFDFL